MCNSNRKIGGCRMKIRVLRYALAALASAMVCGPALAAETGLTAVPTNWRLQNYVSGGGTGVVLWFTGSVCANGQLLLPSTSGAADHERLFSLILSAKISQRPVFIIYETTNCVITSFGMDGP